MKSLLAFFPLQPTVAAFAASCAKHTASLTATRPQGDPQRAPSTHGAVNLRSLLLPTGITLFGLTTWRLADPAFLVQCGSCCLKFPMMSFCVLAAKYRAECKQYIYCIVNMSSRSSRARLPLLDLFSGMGGFSLALHKSFCTVAYCEQDTYCQKVLENNMRKRIIDQAPIHSDITCLDVNMMKIKPVMITAGFPCQDISQANHNATGLEGAKSSLFWHVMRIVKGCPTIKAVMLENSPYIVDRGLSCILSAFLRLGFEVRWGVFSAADVGAPQLRKRFFALASRMSDSVSMSIPAYKFDWQHERGARVIKRSELDGDGRKRLHALGNAVVPSCVTFAFRVLSQKGTSHDSNAMTKTVHVCRRGSSAQILDISVPSAIQRSKTLYLEADGQALFTRQLWATPVSSGTRCTQTMHSSHRATTLLPNQVLRERGTIKFIQKKGHSIKEANIIKNWAVNPDFVEWLQGYPLHFSKSC